MKPQLDVDFDGWCVFHPLTFGILDISLQSLEHPFALWASNILGAKPFAIASSYQGVSLALPDASLKEHH